jgi:hypothetical protein
MSVLLGFFAFAVVLVFASASGDGPLDEVSVPVTVLIVAGAAALAIIVLCVLGWGLLLVLGLYFRHSRQQSAASTRSTEIVQLPNLHRARQLSPASHCSTCSTIGHSSPIPTRLQTKRLGVYTHPVHHAIPTSKSELSALMASGKQATRRVCFSNPELAAYGCKTKADLPTVLDEANVGQGNGVSCHPVSQSYVHAPQAATQSDPLLLRTWNSMPATHGRLPTGWQHDIKPYQ